MVIPLMKPNAMRIKGRSSALGVSDSCGLNYNKMCKSAIHYILNINFNIDLV